MLSNICSECGSELRTAIIDVDGTNLENGFVCTNPNCDYETLGVEINCHGIEGNEGLTEQSWNNMNESERIDFIKELGASNDCAVECSKMMFKDLPDEWK